MVDMVSVNAIRSECIYLTKPSDTEAVLPKLEVQLETSGTERESSAFVKLTLPFDDIHIVYLDSVNMAMDWSAYGNYIPTPQEDIEDDEDFYGAGQDAAYLNGNHMPAAAGANAHDKVGRLESFIYQRLLISTILQQPANTSADLGSMRSNNNSPMTPSADEQKKHEQQKHLEALRKRLMAKKEAGGRPDTPSKVASNSGAPPPQQTTDKKENDTATNNAKEQPNDDFGIESLLAEGKAAAELKVVRDQEAAQKALEAAMQTPANMKQQQAAAMGHAMMDTGEVKPTIVQAQTQNSPSKPADAQTNNTTTNTHPVNVSDPYYEDLAVWLEFTGYHDVQFRNSKLSTYKERRELEQEAARIAEKLEKLKKAEKADLESLRATTAHPTTANPMAPPPLPPSMPAADARANRNGVKRPHSPEPSPREKSSRRVTDSGFRFRGANEQSAPMPRDNGSPLERRDSLPERRRSLDDRDPSLERHPSNNYGQRDARANGRGGHNQWPSTRDGPPQFNARDRERERDGRLGFSSVNRIGGPQARANDAGLDLRKGGQSNFRRYN